jgi:hypothetical protein
MNGAGRAAIKHGPLDVTQSPAQGKSAKNKFRKNILTGFSGALLRSSQARPSPAFIRTDFA